MSVLPHGKVAMNRTYSTDSLCLPNTTDETMSPVQRWDGHRREATDWNELRRDPELFFPNGNTLIYLYSRGRSQRGPSFRIPYDFLLYSGCRPLVEQSLISTIPISPYGDQETSSESDESYLYLHAPHYLNREESFAYHVTTRNFFAWLMGAPIVGRDPVSALLALKDRMDVWRDEASDNFKAICDYVREQGYGDISQIEDQLSPSPKASLYRDRISRYEDAPTLQTRPKRSGSIAAARQSLRKRVRFSESFHHRPHLADLIRPEKKDSPSVHVPLREDALATIAYKDTSADTAPSLTAWQPKPKRTRSIGWNSNYTEIVVPDYGNGLHKKSASTDDSTNTTSASSSAPSIPQTSPSEAYTRRPSQTSSSNNNNDHDHETTYPPLSPSPSSSSSRHSNVPSLSSTYSTEAGEGDPESDSPTLRTPDLPSSFPPAYTFHDHHTTNKRVSEADTANPRVADPHPTILGPNASSAGKETHPDLAIDALITELEEAEIWGKPRGREGEAMERYLRMERLGLGVGFAG